MTHTLGTAKRVQARLGICPNCGYQNHPDAQAHDRDEVQQCNRCHFTWNSPSK